MVERKKNRKKRQRVLKSDSAIKRITSRILWIGYDIAFYSAIILLIAFAVYGYSVTDELKEGFKKSRWKIPGKVYSDSFTMLAGQNVHTQNLVGRLTRLNYQKVSGVPQKQGEYFSGKGHIDIYLRDFEYPHEKFEGYLLRLTLDEGKIDTLTNINIGEQIFTADLEPEIIGRFFGVDREERDLVSYDEVSQYLIQAIVAIEDKAFFRHHGLNFRGLARMVVANIKAGALVQGGSSITQQTVKNVFLTNEKTISRKVKEMAMAVVLEMLYTKEEIFETYLNEVYFGQSGSVSICGVGEASRFYFGKNVRTLDMEEAALLAGLIRSPAVYNPRKRVERAKIRRDYILTCMARQKLITMEEAEQAKMKKIKVQIHTPSYTIAPYFIEFLKKQLSEKYSSEVLISEGLRVFTTLDVQMQKKAEEAMKQGISDLENKYKKLTEDPKHQLQSAMIVTEPQTGYIRAMIGGRKFVKDINRAVETKRQTGSVFKPFVYCSAFVLAEKGRLDFSPVSIIVDEPVEIPTGSGTWRPRNYNKKHVGPVTARRALEKSINIPAVKVAQIVGMNDVIKVAKDMGIRTKLPPYPAVALGSADLSLLEVANAYGTLASLGTRTEPLSVRDVMDSSGKVLSKKSVRVEQAIPPGAAFLTVNLMKGVLDRGTSVRARAMGFKAPAAGKTGTTNDYRDSWFVGFTPDLLCAVWVGYDKDKNLGLTGSQAALPLWTRFMISQYKDSNTYDWEPPSSVVFHKIDYNNGQLAVAECPKIIEEAFIKGQEPEFECEEHKDPVVEFFKTKVGGPKNP